MVIFRFFHNVKNSGIVSRWGRTVRWRNRGRLNRWHRSKYRTTRNSSSKIRTLGVRSRSLESWFRHWEFLNVVNRQSRRRHLTWGDIAAQPQFETSHSYLISAVFFKQMECWRRVVACDVTGVVHGGLRVQLIQVQLILSQNCINQDWIECVIECNGGISQSSSQCALRKHARALTAKRAFQIRKASPNARMIQSSLAMKHHSDALTLKSNYKCPDRLLI